MCKMIYKTGAVLFMALLLMHSLYAQPGVLDPSFGIGGWARANFGPAAASEAEAVVVQYDGKVIAGGWSQDAGTKWHISLARFSTSGMPDPTFGISGTVQHNVVADSNVQSIVAMAIDPADASIVVAGTLYQPATNVDIFVCRFAPNGFIDGSFGNNQGCRIIDYNSGWEYTSGVALDTMGRVVVSGTNYPYSGAPHIPMLLRLLPNGDIDTSFSGDGIAIFPECFDCESKGVAIQPDQKIVMAGDGVDTAATYDAAGRDPFAIRVTEAGVRDPGFALNGLFLYDVVGGEEFIEGMGLYNDGRIILAGTAITDTASLPAPIQTDGRDLLVVRLRPDGWLDDSCALGSLLGARLVPVWFAAGTTNEDYGMAMVVDNKNRTIVSGYKGQYLILASVLDSLCSVDSMYFGPYGNGTNYARYDTTQTFMRGVAIDASVSPYRLLVAGHTLSGPVLKIMTVGRFGGYSVGVFEPAGARLALQVYPNPLAGDGCYVFMDAPENLHGRFELRDLNGRLAVDWGIREIEAGPRHMWLPVPVHLPSGVYSLSVTAAEGRGAVLLIKMQ